MALFTTKTYFFLAGCSTDSFQIDWINLYRGWLFKDKGFFDIPICLDEFWCTTKDYWSFSSYFDLLHRFKGSNPIRILFLILVLCVSSRGVDFPLIWLLVYHFDKFRWIGRVASHDQNYQNSKYHTVICCSWMCSHNDEIRKICFRWPCIGLYVRTSDKTITPFHEGLIPYIN